MCDMCIKCEKCGELTQECVSGSYIEYHDCTCGLKKPLPSVVNGLVVSDDDADCRINRKKFSASFPFVDQRNKLENDVNPSTCIRFATLKNIAAYTCGVHYDFLVNLSSEDLKIDSGRIWRKEGDKFIAL